MVKIEDFSIYCQSRGIKLSTLRLHIYGVNRLMKFCGLKNLKDVRIGHVYSFIDELHRIGCKNRYINIFIGTFKVLGHFLKRKKLEKLRDLKEEVFIKATMADDEIERFLSIPPTKYSNIENWKLWRLFFSVLAFSGMRPGEVANLTPDCVDFGRGVFILEDTKTNEPRYVPIPEHLRDELERCIAKTKHDGIIFATMHGNKFDDTQWHYHFHTGINKLGIRRKNLSVYSLRHSCLTRLVEEDVNITKVQKIAGHRRIETTLQYTHLTTKDIVEALKKDRMTMKYLNAQTLLDMVERFTDNLIKGNTHVFYRKNQESGLLEISLKLDTYIPHNSASPNQF